VPAVMDPARGGRLGVSSDGTPTLRAHRKRLQVSRPRVVSVCVERRMRQEGSSLALDDPGMGVGDAGAATAASSKHQTGYNRNFSRTNSTSVCRC